MTKRQTINTAQRNSKQERILLGIVLAILVIAYNFIWLNKTFTMSEGWSEFYVGLMDQGKVPYRDFYYYLPPLNLLVDYIIWKCSFGYFFVYRLFRLAERVLIVELTYKILSKKVSPFISMAGCFLSAILASANVYDLVGDYNQTVQLLTVILVCLVIKYFDNLDNIKEKRKWMFFIGICGGCMFLTKQTIVIAAAIVFSVLVLILFITKKEKNLFQMIISVGLGCAVPLGICLVYFVFTHSLTEFVQQVFIETSSKGSIVDIVLGSQVDLLQNIMQALEAMILFLVFYIVWNKNKNKSLKKEKNISFFIAELVLFAIASAIIVKEYYDLINGIISVNIDNSFAFVFLIIALLILLLKNERLTFVVFIDSIVLCGVLFYNDYNNWASDMYSETDSFTSLTTTATIIYVFLIIWLIYHIVRCLKNKKQFDMDALALVAGGVASGWSTSMATGVGTISTISSFVLIPALVYVVFKNKKFSSKTSKKLFLILIIAVFTVALSQKVQCSYTWWGDTEASISEKTETSDIKCLKGFKFSKEEKNKYDELTALIEEYTDEDSVIFGFPYVKVYNIFLENYNMDTFVPVLFYDVCADSYAEKDAKTLAENEPDIVVWLDIEDCMEQHETLYRNGEYLGQRKIQKWFSKARKNDYDLVGQVGDVYVYKLKSNTSSDSTFIENKSKSNKTAKYKLNSRVTLKGFGSEEDPYKISSAEDLMEFRDLVNKGVSFKDQYVELTADIDLTGTSSWEPIGKFETSDLFDGTFDGNGYKIIGLKIEYDPENDEDTGHNGLFGDLVGTVKNLSVVDCDISGTYIGGISSQGEKGSAIINCYVSGKLNAEQRAGGIADNLSSTIINCVSECEVEGKIAGGIAGYYATTVTYCYSTQGNNASEEDGLPITSYTIDYLNTNVESFTNEYLDYEETTEDSADLGNLNLWETNSEGKLELTNEKIIIEED